MDTAHLASTVPNVFISVYISSCS